MGQMPSISLLKVLDDEFKQGRMHVRWLIGEYDELEKAGLTAERVGGIRDRLEMLKTVGEQSISGACADLIAKLDELTKRPPTK